MDAGPSATGGRGRGNILWGGAVDNQNAYYGVGAMGLGALNPATGQSVWVFAPPPPATGLAAALGAAPTAIPGVVFEGASNGMLYAVSADGRVRQRLVLADGDVREPAWSPFRQR